MYSPRRDTAGTSMVQLVRRRGARPFFGRLYYVPAWACLLLLARTPLFFLWEQGYVRRQKPSPHLSLLTRVERERGGASDLPPYLRLYREMHRIRRDKDRESRPHDLYCRTSIIGRILIIRIFQAPPPPAAKRACVS
jgi:hypothetical protein